MKFSLPRIALSNPVGLKQSRGASGTKAQIISCIFRGQIDFDPQRHAGG